MNKINRLYIHVPFCRKKCSYCAFHSVTISDDLAEKYLTKLEEDIKENSHLAESLESIFIGGGTPSILTTRNLEKLFSIINSNFKIQETAEISIENNPETLTPEKIRIISNFANRVSIGIQSFNDKNRSIIGRNGNIKNIYSIVDKLIENKIDNISIDLIYGIPTQTLKDWEHELATAIKLPIKHISAYALTYEEGTKLYTTEHSGQSAETDEISAEMWQLTSDILHQYNISRYEVSNYSSPGYQCKHNLDTWYGGKYLGFGPTASSFDGKYRWIQPTLQPWLEKKSPEKDYLNLFDRTVEIFMMGLRTAKGWKIIDNKNNNHKILTSIFPNNYYFKPNEWNKIYQKLNRLSQIKLLEFRQVNKKETDIFPTEKGLLFWDEIALELLE